MAVFVVGAQVGEGSSEGEEGGAGHVGGELGEEVEFRLWRWGEAR